MNIAKEFMGRAIIAPKNSANAGELWLNIGFNSKGNSMWPSYPAELRGHVDENEYKALQSEIQALMDEAGLDASMMQIAMCLCALKLVPCALCMCYYMKTKVDGLDAKVREVIDKHDKNWGGGLRMQRCDMTSPTAQAPDAMAVDTTGRPVEKFFKQGKHGGSNKPCWPPLGYNIIVPAGKWSPQAPGAYAAQAPPVVVMAQVVGSTGATRYCTSCGAALPDGSKFCAECGAQAATTSENNPQLA